MLREHVVRVANITLRGMTLVSKFVLLFFLAKFLQASEVGLYGLLSATIGYALYVIGFEFYNFSTREMIGEDSKHWLGDDPGSVGLVWGFVLHIPALRAFHILYGVAPMVTRILVSRPGVA